MFVTLTFPKSAAPTEDEAQDALARLVRRLRYRNRLSEYGWVLQRQRNGTLHFHGIWWMRWWDDDLAEWRRLVELSGFGPQQRIEIAESAHARYCASYIARDLADLKERRRAFGFSRKFPKPPPFQLDDSSEEVAGENCEVGVVPPMQPVLAS
jgi:hypothetical protein